MIETPDNHEHSAILVEAELPAISPDDLHSAFEGL